MQCSFQYTVGQGHTALAVSAGGGCLDIFFISSIVSLYFLPLSGRWPRNNDTTLAFTGTFSGLW